MDQIYKLIKLKTDKKETVLFFVYYSGHGVMQNTSYCVLNSPYMYDRYFDLEIKVRYLAETPGTMGILIFDCCRDNPAKGEDVK